MTRAICVLILSAPITSSAWSDEVMPLQLYEVVTETAMPNLEENLRYTITREQRCTQQSELWSAFPILHHTALKDCKLDHQNREQDTLSYDLICEGGHGTTGRAIWQIGRNQSTGTLNVKLGGKNMTFYQRVSARALGKC
jgi:hypothetical protein